MDDLTEMRHELVMAGLFDRTGDVSRAKREDREKHAAAFVAFLNANTDEDTREKSSGLVVERLARTDEPVWWLYETIIEYMVLEQLRQLPLSPSTVAEDTQSSHRNWLRSTLVFVVGLLAERAAAWSSDTFAGHRLRDIHPDKVYAMENREEFVALILAMLRFPMAGSYLHYHCAATLLRLGKAGEPSLRYLVQLADIEGVLDYMIWTFHLAEDEVTTEPVERISTETRPCFVPYPKWVTAVDLAVLLLTAEPTPEVALAGGGSLREKLTQICDSVHSYLTTQRASDDTGANLNACVRLLNAIITFQPVWEEQRAAWIRRCCQGHRILATYSRFVGPHTRAMHYMERADAVDNIYAFFNKLSYFATVPNFAASYDDRQFFAELGASCANVYCNEARIASACSLCGAFKVCSLFCYDDTMAAHMAVCATKSSTNTEN